MVSGKYKMKYRTFHNTGLTVSEIGIGTNRFGHNVDQKEVNNILTACKNYGVNFLDTANVYANGRSEECIGKYLKDNRKDFVIATKVGWPNDDDKGHGRLSAVNVNYHVENSLKKLNTDYIDILYLHKWDEITPISETLRNINILINQGKIRYLAISNFNQWQTALTYNLAKTTYDIDIIALQSEFNLIKRNIFSEMEDLLKYLNINFIPFFPLASGFLTGKYKKDIIPVGSRGEWSDNMKEMFSDKYYKYIEELEVITKIKKISLSELAINWLLCFGNITSVICGVRSVKQLEMNIKSINCILSKEELEQIDAAYKILVS